MKSSLRAIVSLSGLVLLMLTLSTGCSQQQAENKSGAQSGSAQTTTPDQASTSTPAENSAGTSAGMTTTENSTPPPGNKLTTGSVPTTGTPAGTKSVAVPANLQFAVTDLNGQSKQSKDWFTGTPVVLNFWGTWCPPCRREIPALVEINKEYAPKGVKLVSLSYNDELPQLSQFVQANGMTWAQYQASEDVVASFGIQGFPTTIFYSADGKELGRMVGGRSHEEFHAAFAQLIQ